MSPIFTLSLSGLAVSDIGCLSTLIWSNICITPAFMEAGLPFEPIEFQHLTSGMPHATFTRITAWITALITLERCLCIAAPLQVSDRHIRVSEVASIIVGRPIQVIYKYNRASTVASTLACWHGGHFFNLHSRHVLFIFL